MSTRAAFICTSRDEELARRRAAWAPPPPRYLRGYGAMYAEHIGQADEGCDFDFLLAGAGDAGAGDSLRNLSPPGQKCGSLRTAVVLHENTATMGGGR